MSNKAGFDFSGFHRFGELADMLVQGREPSAADWDSLFSLPGYVALTTSEFPRDVFTERMRLAYLPERQDERDAILAEKRSMLVAHFVEVRNRWTELAAAAERIAVAGLESGAVELASVWLPSERLLDRGEQRLATPPVAFLIFAKDGRGYEPVVMDVAFAAEMTERDLQLMLAHEFHHYYRNRLLTFGRDDTQGGWSDLLWVVDQIHAEGIADLINVPESIYGSGPWAAAPSSVEYRAAVEAAPQFLGRFDGDLAALSSICGLGSVDPEDSIRQVTELATGLKRALPRSGHPIGYYMASFLQGRGCKADLVRTVGDPFAFFELYHAAATDAGLAGFSDGARAGLAALAKRFSE